MAQKNMTAYVILGLLAHEEASGYDLKKKIDMAISHFWEVGYGQLYPTLKALEEEGAIVGTAASSAKGPDRIVYQITKAGEQKLTDWLALPHAEEHLRYEILLKLFFGHLSSPEQNIARIEDFRRRHLHDLELMDLFKKNLAAVFADSPDHLYYYLTALFGDYVYKAYLAWCDEAVTLIRQHTVTGGDEA